MTTNGHQRLSDMGSTHDDSFRDETFLLLKAQIKKVQHLVDLYNTKIVDNELCAEDLVNMETEMKKLKKLDKQVTCNRLKSSFVPYKSMYLKLVKESYRICNWVIEKQFNQMDDMFEINTFVKKILSACDGEANPLKHIDVLFKGVLKNTDCCNLNFYGNIHSFDVDDTSILTQNKREYKKSQKRQLEELVVPNEAENEVGDDELQIGLKRVHRCLKEAVSNNQGKPISFYKFAIDPFSLTYSVQNLFNLASLAKDGVIKIERAPGEDNDEFTTVTVVKSKNKDNAKTNIRASFFTINQNLWKFYIEKYKITERMIEQIE